MSGFARTDTSLLGRWWWTIDHWSLIALISLMGVGAILVLTVSPAAAERIGGLESFQLARRQIIFMALAAGLILAVSLLSPRWVRRLGVLGFFFFLALLALTLIVGTEIKGAARWLNIAGLSIQPSEFIKPCFAVVAAWLLSAEKSKQGIPGTGIATVLWLSVLILLLLQPDVGQAFVVSAVWGMQLFLAGLPLLWIGLLGLAGVTGMVATYFLLPHFAQRIDGFLDPAAGDRYQVERAIDAFNLGGLFGRGPGEGRVKALLPDAHSDFILAVAGEEFGLFVCLAILGLFAFIVLRGFTRLLQENSLFILLAGTGVLTQFALQALINMASTLHLMPTKGMTLPFISYGGSSALAVALGMGMVLAFTRRRVGVGEGQ